MIEELKTVLFEAIASTAFDLMPHDNRESYFEGVNTAITAIQTSAEFAETVLNYQDLYNVDISKEELERLKTKADVVDSLQKRLKHLFRSKVVSALDLVDNQTHEYINDIEAFDTEFQKYKKAFEIISNSNSCNDCKRRYCSSKRIGEKVAYNCPMHKPI